MALPRWRWRSSHAFLPNRFSSFLTRLTISPWPVRKTSTPPGGRRVWIFDTLLKASVG